MQQPHGLVDLILHLDKYLPVYVQQYGTQIYFILFAIVFGETGLIVLPFLPGDSLLFAAGAVGAAGKMNVGLLYPLFIAAALCGDNVNYWVGRSFGRRLFAKEKSRVFRRDNLAKTEVFFAKYGPKAIIMARFVPVVRTFAPFVAGMSNMPYGRFLAFSIGGAVLWVSVCLTAGVLLGQQPFVEKHFTSIILAVIVVSLVPMLIEFLIHRRGTNAAPGAPRSGEKP